MAEMNTTKTRFISKLQARKLRLTIMEFCNARMATKIAMMAVTIMYGMGHFLLCGAPPARQSCYLLSARTALIAFAIRLTPSTIRSSGMQE